MESLKQDWHYSLRMLWKSQAFIIVAVIEGASLFFEKSYPKAVSLFMHPQPATVRIKVMSLSTLCPTNAGALRGKIGMVEHHLTSRWERADLIIVTPG